MSQPNTGIMSRFAILGWINDTLLVHLTKIEQLGAGNIYCQLLDAVFPGRVPLNKVKWEAKFEVDFLHNFKVLQTSFDILGISKKIEVQKLVKAKFQDNLEFVLWFHTTFHQRIDGLHYQPLKRRNYANINLDFANKKSFNLTLNNNKLNSSISNMSKSNLNSSLCSSASIQSAAHHRVQRFESSSNLHRRENVKNGSFLHQKNPSMMNLSAMSQCTFKNNQEQATSQRSNRILEKQNWSKQHPKETPNCINNNAYKNKKKKLGGLSMLYSSNNTTKEKGVMMPNVSVFKGVTIVESDEEQQI